MDADDSEYEPIKSVMELPSVGDGNTDWSEGANSYEPLLDNNLTSTTFSDYSTTVIRARISSLSSILTLRGHSTSPAADSPDSKEKEEPVVALLKLPLLLCTADLRRNLGTACSVAPFSPSPPSTGTNRLTRKAAPPFILYRAITPPPLVHRFSLLKPGTKPRNNGFNGTASPPGSNGNGEVTAGWNPLDLFFSSGLFVAKCDICTKRLGWKPVLECDDCGLRSVFSSSCLDFTDIDIWVLQRAYQVR
jgi:LIM domain kinase 1